MSEITTLQPSLLWKWFDQICAIPHPSHYEDTLANFIVNWAKEKHFFLLNAMKWGMSSFVNQQQKEWKITHLLCYKHT